MYNCHLFARVCLPLAFRLRTSLALEVKKVSNIVLITVDDQTCTEYGFMGLPYVRTPVRTLNFGRLVAERVTYPRGYVPASLCCLTLATIVQTGCKSP